MATVVAPGSDSGSGDEEEKHSFLVQRPVKNIGIFKGLGGFGVPKHVKTLVLL